MYSGVRAVGRSEIRGKRQAGNCVELGSGKQQQAVGIVKQLPAEEYPVSAAK